ncbi:alpha/beta fold hydrolase [Arthrobacter sp. zg-Y1110]|uniref:alpha/beta fold hydrolase n=1 Tax=Arthrobacter sp. zg-Y1110 TaxID=2886932 RepID=UPI001D13D3C4|nr:alpha/beta hydrolase [Arthrobacter sp. zg-Y1110]MCC3289355.1 alpha/beta hydrolase [Arthrobacter sp. zg-Y1110]UWX85195.1 alpha/beta hydrolase [Arthrobacter sp. zg-Y1110]
MKTTLDSQPRLDGVTHRTVNVGGLNVHVAEAGQGPPLVLLHGFPEHWWQWHRIIGPLAENHRVICPDGRGAGWTDAPGTGYGRDQLAADFLGLLDALGLEKVGVLSHDWGSLVTYQVCLRNPDRVSAHLSLSIPPPYFNFDIRMVLTILRHVRHNVVAVPVIGAALLRPALVRRVLADFSAAGSFTEQDLDLFAGRYADPARSRAGSALYRQFINPEGVRIMRGAYRNTRLATRTRVLIGTDDPGMQAGFVHGYEQFCDDLEVDYLSGANHFVAADRPDAVIAAAREVFA